MSSPNDLPIVLSYQLKSEGSAIQKVIDNLRKLMVLYHPESHWFKIELLLREAFNNCINHGNCLNQEKFVSCTIHLDQCSITISLKDEGIGFNWRQAIQKASNQIENAEINQEENIPMIENSRGLEIFILYADSFYFNETGTELTFTIDIAHNVLNNKSIQDFIQKQYNL